MMLAAEGWSHAEGFKRLYLHFNDDRSKNFYKRLNYQQANNVEDEDSKAKTNDKTKLYKDLDS